MQCLNSGGQQFDVISMLNAPEYTPPLKQPTPLFFNSASKPSMYIQNKMVI